jgi:hypothetical protein
MRTHFIRIIIYDSIPIAFFPKKKCDNENQDNWEYSHKPPMRKIMGEIACTVSFTSRTGAATSSPKSENEIIAMPSKLAIATMIIAILNESF